MVNPLSTAGYVHLSVYIGFCLIVLLRNRSNELSSMLWGCRRGLFLPQRNDSVGNNPALHCHATLLFAPTRSARGMFGLWYVRVLEPRGFTKRIESRNTGQQLGMQNACVAIGLLSQNPGHATCGARRGTRLGGGARSGTNVRQQKCSPSRQCFLVQSKASKTHPLNLLPRSTKKQNPS